MRDIYVSGPIMAPGADGGLPTDLEVQARKRKFNEVSAFIRSHAASGQLVINPLDVEACSGLMVNDPICSGLEDGKHTWQCYLRHDLKVMVMCDIIVMLPEWEHSPGANVEKKVAEMLGLEVLYWCDQHSSAHHEACDEKECQGV